MTRTDTPKQDFKRIIADQLAAFEAKENEMNLVERRDRAVALGLPLSLAAQLAPLAQDLDRGADALQPSA